MLHVARRFCLYLGLCVMLGMLAPQTPRAQTPEDDLIQRLEKPLTFIDGRDNPVSSDDFKGKWLLVYFGYMHCADLCPWGLTVLGTSIDMLGPAMRHIQPLFVTVDPQRDRGAALAEFTRSFHDSIIGLTGSDAQIRAATDAMGVKFSRVQQGKDYSIDHTSAYSLIDPERRKVITFRKAEAHQVAAKVVDVLTRAGVNLDGLRGIGALR